MTVSEGHEPGMVTVADLDAHAVAALPGTVFASAVRRALAEWQAGEPRAHYVVWDRVLL